MIIASLGLIPGLTLSAQAAATFSTDTTLSLTGITLTVLTGSTADSVAVNSTANTVAVTVSGTQVLILKSPNNIALTNDGGYDACQGTGGVVQLSVSGTKTVTFSPTTSVTCPAPVSSSGGGGGGGGGGSSTPAPSTPAPVVTTPVVTPAPTTPAVEPVVTPTTPAVTATPVSLPAAAAPVAVLIHDPSNFEALLTALGTTSKPADYAKYNALVKSDALAFKVGLTDLQVKAIANFETYGASTATVKLGAGERRALVRDYLETVGRADFVWDDIQRLATGEKPVKRNLAKEVAQAGIALDAFKKMTGHAPNFKDKSEDIAWNTMLYRIRFPRDLKLEQQGILEYQKIFKGTPTTPAQWAMVRALGYALK
ncbi:hypothetical protein A2318_03510 [Candidatus Uhrbacteria bacterium RIFOXYB2_FULL_45_11]|uniref:DUF5667 domain-containing protein n=1 Tax=Candidatus Uhrbacteria bacterium RIFOXYB2_FULL_45_11 TaxID=1802421 RepID=A0A1F7W5Q5_9BACT|nr:MAG: hypothetical protein A2318_03510 [Candidatus Uhrbacteria bacterium RIFOXYB2_FULL_45_11]